MDNKLRTELNKRIKTNDIPKNNPITPHVQDYETNDEFDEDKYDDTMQDDTLENTKIEYRKKLLEISTELLPCPNKLFYEASFSPPTQDEVKFFFSSSAPLLISVTVKLIVILRLLTTL